MAFQGTGHSFNLSQQLTYDTLHSSAVRRIASLPSGPVNKTTGYRLCIHGTMMTSPEPSPIPSDGDGPVDRIWKRPPKKPVAAIFIHAGAGYHSIMNERVHLQACSE